MSDSTPTPTETKPAEEATKLAAEPAAGAKPEALKQAALSSASSAVPEDTPDVSHSSEYKTNEEDEETLIDVRSKLYRFHAATKEWRERGTGQAKVLRHKTTNKIRFVMRRERTYKICGNHYILPTMNLQVNKNNDKSWIWDCPADYSEDPSKPSADIYAIRFTSAEDTAKFKTVWAEAQAAMQKLVDASKAEATPADK